MRFIERWSILVGHYTDLPLSPWSSWVSSHDQGLPGLICKGPHSAVTPPFPTANVFKGLIVRVPDSGYQAASDGGSPRAGFQLHSASTKSSGVTVVQSAPLGNSVGMWSVPQCFEHPPGEILIAILRQTGYASSPTLSKILYRKLRLWVGRADC